MNFDPTIRVVSGGEIPNNSIALLYSPGCPHCHHMVPQFNQIPQMLRAGGFDNTQVVAVDVNSEFYALRAGGISVMGVPHVVIKTLQGGIIDYNGPRMADSIAQEAARVLNGGETKLLNGGAQEDALLGGSTAVAAPAAETPVTGGAAPAADAAALEGGKKRRKRSKSRSRSRRRRMHGGEEVTGGAAELEGGKKRRRRSKSRSRRRRMHGGEAAAPVEAAPAVTGGATEAPVAGGAVDAAALEGGKKRRRRSRSKSRSRRRRMHGGEEVAGGAADAAAIEGGKRRKSRSRSRSRKSPTKWMRLVMDLYKSGRYSSYKSAMKAAKKMYHK